LNIGQRHRRRRPTRRCVHRRPIDCLSDQRGIELGKPFAVFPQADRLPVGRPQLDLQRQQLGQQLIGQRGVGGGQFILDPRPVAPLPALQKTIAAIVDLPQSAQRIGGGRIGIGSRHSSVPNSVTRPIAKCGIERRTMHRARQCNAGNCEFQASRTGWMRGSRPPRRTPPTAR
jgi:hypothetical protein